MDSLTVKSRPIYHPLVAGCRICYKFLTLHLAFEHGPNKKVTICQNNISFLGRELDTAAPLSDSRPLRRLWWCHQLNVVELSFRDILSSFLYGGRRCECFIHQSYAQTSAPRYITVLDMHGYNNSQHTIWHRERVSWWQRQNPYTWRHSPKYAVLQSFLSLLPLFMHWCHL